MNKLYLQYAGLIEIYYLLIFAKWLFFINLYERQSPEGMFRCQKSYFYFVRIYLNKSVYFEMKFS